MSLLEGITDKLKNKLHKQSTVVTTISGHKYLETTDRNGKRTMEKLGEATGGYIIDTKPDLQIAEITSYLYLGSQDVVAERPLLLNNSITHVLSLGVKPFIEFNGISYKFIDLLDLPEENLLEILPVTNDLIDAVRKRDGSKVFVHCSAGCSRAPSVVIAYLMFAEKITFSKALERVRKVRYIRPNEGFVSQLKKYENLLEI